MDLPGRRVCDGVDAGTCGGPVRSWYIQDMGWEPSQSGAVALLSLALLLPGCAKTEYVGNGNKGFWSDQPAKVSPNDAFRKAQPHLEATWKVRCEKVRNQDAYCDKPPLDHMVRRGSYYYVTRTSYPYENYDRLTEYAVKVHVDTGEVTPLK